jgi:alkylated DNA repair dioxygenase AlkB
MRTRFNEIDNSLKSVLERLDWACYRIDEICGDKILLIDQIREDDSYQKLGDFLSYAAERRANEDVEWCSQYGDAVTQAEALLDEIEAEFHELIEPIEEIDSNTYDIELTSIPDDFPQQIDSFLQSIEGYKPESESESSSVVKLKKTIVDGLFYLPEYISRAEEQKLIELIDSGEWDNHYRRRMQYHGNVYKRNELYESKILLGELPDWLSELANRFVEDGLISKAPDSVVVNDYPIGVGFPQHRDDLMNYEEVVIAISLGADIVIDFNSLLRTKEVGILLEARSLMLMMGEARGDWRHGIARRKSDRINGSRIPRQRRLSITFRNVRLRSQAASTIAAPGATVEDKSEVAMQMEVGTDK